MLLLRSQECGLLPEHRLLQAMGLYKFNLIRKGMEPYPLIANDRSDQNNRPYADRCDGSANPEQKSAVNYP
ncbi:hypothetical protein GCM10010911_47640 [Paenibacillus nasutitermitis]|uniref:Uncharacterized protein n=1 Tax=Paenibacillus nasutitermitis TaxID=1652958 RepID=A0A916ZA66_9BACL|nr:hypothetical protein GCM10010911_47640 [Paenibacillus nasutitermitis]